MWRYPNESKARDSNTELACNSTCTITLASASPTAQRRPIFAKANVLAVRLLIIGAWMLPTSALSCSSDYMRPKMPSGCGDVRTWKCFLRHV